MTLSQAALYAFETALFWTVLESTGSSFRVSVLYVGIVAPVLVLIVPVGMIVDRFGPRRLLLAATVAATVGVGLGALLALAGQLSFELALLLAIAEGVFFGCWAIPAQIIAGRLVDQSRMTSAIGLSSMPTAIGALTGGLLGGIILAAAGVGPTLVVSTLGLGLSAAVISRLPATPGLAAADAASGPVRHVVAGQLGDAVAWTRRTPVALAVIALGFAAGLFVMSRFALTPILVRDVLGSGPAGLGMLTAAGGLGSFVGSMAVDATGRRFRRGRALLGAFAIAGCALALLGSAPNLAIALVAASGITTTMIIYQVTSMTLLQVLAPGRMRGRVMALYDMVRLGLVPVGSLVAGALAPIIGVSAVLGLFGGATVAAAVVVAIACRPLLDLVLDAGPTPDAAGPTPDVTDAEPDAANAGSNRDPALGRGPAGSG